jgi:hypothetical protein
MGRDDGMLRARPVEEHLRIDDEGRAVRVVDVHQRFGGFDAGASIAGALAALGATVLIGGILGGIGTIGYQLDLERGTEELSAAGLIGGLVTLFVAFLIGGWVAGRMARYDGGRNGLMTAVWFILAAAALAAIGAWLGDRYNVFDDLAVPRWFSDNATTAVAIISGVGAAVVMLAAGFVGGLLGARYHHKADAYLAAEERDRFTGNERIETLDAAGRRTVTGGHTPLATERVDDVDLRERRDADIDLREREEARQDEARRDEVADEARAARERADQAEREAAEARAANTASGRPAPHRPSTMREF